MFKNSILKKSSSILAASIVSTAAILPVNTAYSHDRHNPNRHYGAGQHLNKHQHRQFHNQYGRGQHGTRTYRSELHAHKQRLRQQRHQQQHSHKKRRNKKGELIAAGIIGLAVGAIIASESSKRKYRKQEPTDYNQTPRQNIPQGYHYDPSGYNGSGYTNGGRLVPLNDYNNGTRYNGPEVITFNEPSTLEPWTPGWREWCQNRYRSFNASTGTFRGYDGLDHFCVPK